MLKNPIHNHWDEVLTILKENGKDYSDAARQIYTKYNYEHSIDAGRKAIRTRLLASSHTGLEAECDAVGIPVDNVKHYWHKGKHYSINVNAQKETDYAQALQDVLAGYTFEKKKPTPANSKTWIPKAIKVTLSDMHVGLNPNPNNKSLFGYEYNKEIFNEHINRVIESVLKEYSNNGAFDLLLIDDLGDSLDGYNGLTTRGGHSLEQNMTNEQAFSTYVKGKLRLVETLIDAGVANSYEVRNVTDCNHSGSFGAIANISIKMILERVYEKDVVKFTILERFMEHFEYGVHTFILTHGKDGKYMFKGLPYTLNDKATAFINEYIDHYNINTRYIHLEKGDLHRIGYDRTKKFDYRNFMSFAPPSAWVQGNFGDGYSGFSLQVIPKYNGEIQHTDVYFDLKKK